MLEAHFWSYPDSLFWGFFSIKDNNISFWSGELKVWTFFMNISILFLNSTLDMFTHSNIPSNKNLIMIVEILSAFLFSARALSVIFSYQKPWFYFFSGPIQTHFWFVFSGSYHFSLTVCLFSVWAFQLRLITSDCALGKTKGFSVLFFLFSYIPVCRSMSWLQQRNTKMWGGSEAFWKFVDFLCKSSQEAWRNSTGKVTIFSYDSFQSNFYPKLNQ